MTLQRKTLPTGREEQNTFQLPVVGHCVVPVKAFSPSMLLPAMLGRRLDTKLIFKNDMSMRNVFVSFLSICLLQAAVDIIC